MCSSVEEEVTVLFCNLLALLLLSNLIIWLGERLPQLPPPEAIHTYMYTTITKMALCNIVQVHNYNALYSSIASSALATYYTFCLGMYM